MASPHIHVPFDKIGKHMDFISQQKINLEIYFSADMLDTVEYRHILELKNLLSYGPHLSIHAPFMDLSPAAVDYKVKEATSARFKQVFEIAEILQPLLIVFHSGYEKWKYGLSVDLWLKKSLEFWKPLSEDAKSLGCKIAIENIFEEDPDNLRLLMETMSSENFGICFDTGHCNLFTKVSLDRWIDDLGAHIVELHLHDNDGTADQHGAIGDGTFDFDHLFKRLDNKDRIYTIEAHTPEQVLKSIESFKRYR